MLFELIDENEEIFFQTPNDLINNPNEFFDCENFFMEKNNIDSDLLNQDEVDEYLRLNQYDPLFIRLGKYKKNRNFNEIVDLHTEDFDHNSDKQFPLIENNKAKNIICLTTMKKEELSELYELYTAREQNINQIDVIYENVYPNVIYLNGGGKCLHKEESNILQEILYSA